MFVYHLTTWYKCMMDNAFPIRKHNQHHLDLWFIHAFFWSRRPFPHPLRQLHLGFNIIPINPRLISCYDVLKKVFINICIGKQFMTEFNMVLFLIVNKHSTNFVLMRCIFSFSVKILWQHPMLMPTSSATSPTIKWWFPQITAWLLFVDVEGSPDLGYSLADILPSLKCLNHS